MKRVERAAVRSRAWSWTQLQEGLAPAMSGLGFSAGTGDVAVALLDLGQDGRVALFDDAALARRAGLALAKQSGARTDIYEVVGTAGSKRFRFRTEAWLATPEGDLRGADGHDVDLEDPAAWSGDFEEQADQVLEAFAEFDGGAKASARQDFKRKKMAKASSPRVAGLLKALEASKKYEALPQGDGRLELRIELSAGGVQRSFCSASEHEELTRLLGR